VIRGKIAQSFDMFVKDNTVFVEVYFGDRETRSVVRTITSHIRNMMTGVTKVRARASFARVAHAPPRTLPQ
jgi:ribosomal protein L6P/L9E